MHRVRIHHGQQIGSQQPIIYLGACVSIAVPDAVTDRGAKGRRQRLEWVPQKTQLPLHNSHLGRRYTLHSCEVVDVRSILGGGAFKN